MIFRAQVFPSLLHCSVEVNIQEHREREEQTNNKQTYSPVPLCLDCKHRGVKAFVCMWVHVCVQVSKLQSWELEKSKIDSLKILGPWHC